MPIDSICSAIAAAARNGYTATNWSAGDARWGLSAAGANARTYRPCNLIQFAIMGAHITKGKITQLSRSALPINANAGRPLAGPYDSDAYVKMGVPIPALENLTLHLDNANNNETSGALAIFQTPGGRAPQARYQRVIPVRAYAAATLTQYAWSPFALTFEGTLDPNMTYDVLGMSAYSAGAIGARLVSPTPGLDGDTRPTVVPGPTSLTAGLQMFPEVLRFKGSTPPSAEICSLSADTAEELLLVLGEVGTTGGSGMYQQGYQQQ